MFNLDFIKKEDIKKHNLNWPDIPNNLYRILTAGGSGSTKKQMQCVI